MGENPRHIPVLIVGAGGAGLSLAVFLLQQGIRPVLVERRAEVSWHPRARNLNFRTLEIFRGVALAEQIHAAGSPVARLFARSRLASSEDKLLMDPGMALDTRDLSPEPFLWFCPQSRLEPILLRAAELRGADVRYGTELLGFRADLEGVTATLKDRASGEVRIVRAEYLVGCDGGRSHIREALGIPVRGQGVLDQRYVFLYFRIPWEGFVRGHESDAFMIENPDVTGMFLGAERDLGMFVVVNPPADALTPPGAQELLTKAIGRADVPVEVIEIVPWQPVQAVAERFGEGRVFLAGDAAHTMPPKEGLGVNSAIQSSHNLAWKLAAVLKRQAGAELLTTYTAERRPVAWFAAQHSMTGPAVALIESSRTAQKASEFFPSVGYRYRSRAILSDEGRQASDEIALLDDQRLTGLPGSRVPHLWLMRGAQRLSTLDLLDGGFVLLTSTVSGAAWRESAARIESSTGIRITTYQIGPDGDLRDPARDWYHRMGLTPDGALLLRPDGFVAWRGAKEDRLLLEDRVGSLLCRSPV